MVVIAYRLARLFLRKPSPSLSRRHLSTSSSTMSNSKYEYVRTYESDDRLLPNCWIVVRIDGKAFHTFSEKHTFDKPNDKKALDLMNACATRVMKSFNDLVLAYGQSDEYSFVFRKDTELYSRRASKLMTNVVSLFASSYVFHWTEFFPDKKLLYPPTFDSRTVLYPSEKNLRDYLSWRQADCHINNLYNTVFWTLIQKGGLTNVQAQERLSGTFSSDKNEILFSEFGVNYNNEPEQFKKGTTIFRRKVAVPVETKETDGDSSSEGASLEGRKESIGVATKNRLVMMEENCDIIGEQFWQQNEQILGPFRDT